MSFKALGGGLADLPRLKDHRRRRSSSYDRTGGNRDFIVIPDGELAILADMKGVGCIKHIWITIRSSEDNFLRKLVLRMYWDNEKHPSVEVPIGDFFGIGHALTHNFISAPLQMSPENGKGFNCWWPMPYSDGAKLTIENQGNQEVTAFYFYIDYEEWKNSDEGLGRFHAVWNRENPTAGITEKGLDNHTWMFSGENKDGANNYVILEAEGKGHFVGCNMNVHNLRKVDKWNWYGEGDDMIFIDGEPLPSLVGTGTEDYYGMSWCPTQEYNAPYHGLPLPGEKNWRGQITWYRYHIQDPIYFEKSIKVTIEHGHGNRRNDDYSSTAYWYQTEPHKPLQVLLPVKKRLPRKTI